MAKAQCLALGKMFDMPLKKKDFKGLYFSRRKILIEFCIVKSIVEFCKLYLGIYHINFALFIYNLHPLMSLNRKYIQLLI